MPTLDWLNQQDAKRTAQKVPYCLLEAVPELCAGEVDTDNLLIQGDNLQALKALLPLYAGKVKCIYIDPPYNTRSAFEHYDDNLEHSLWLSMMYPRLELLRDLLAEDGSIWVSIDDNEAHYLKVMMDEVFGRGNFVASFAWQKFHSVKSNAKYNISQSHEHILLYLKSENLALFNKIPMSDEALKVYKNPDNDPRGNWRTAPLTVSLLSGARGASFAKTGESTGLYEIVSPNGKKHYPAKGRCWFSKATIDRLIEDKRIWWGKDGNAVPMEKIFLSEKGGVKTISTFWNHDEYGSNKHANQEIKEIFDEEGAFSTPKPERLIQRILQIATNENDLVLDSFLGSGTTAAVAHKMNRRYIGIEMGDHAQTHCQPRLKKVIDGEQGGISKAVNWTGGGGVRFYRLGSAVFDEYGAINPDISFATLAAHIWYIKTHTPLLTPADSPLLGIHNGVAYYLLYNGILKDRKPQNGNVLTNAVLASLPKHDGKKIIFGESTLLRPARLEAEQITFQQIPYDVGVF
jgi:adenine-specific DNA-methyltransferase